MTIAPEASMNTNPLPLPVGGNAAPPVYLVTAGKGGVGKSLMALTLIDLLLSSGKAPLYIETDSTTPDVYRCLRRDWIETLDRPLPGVLLATCSLTERSGWLDLVDLLDAHRDRCVVVNTPPGLDAALLDHGWLLRDSLGELQRDLVTLWMLDRLPHSVRQLEKYVELFPGTVVHAVKNGIFGDAARFEHYNDSAVRQRLESAGGTSMTLPAMEHSLTDAIYNERRAISDALEHLPLGRRAALRQWREQSHREFERLVA
jgi:cellulose biosynthesis protein BcsQ